MGMNSNKFDVLADNMGRFGTELRATTVIGADVTVSGAIRAQGTVWIDGRVEGEIHTDDLLVIGEGAVMVGNVYAGSVICRGVLTGDIVADEEVELVATASFNGTVRAPVLSVDDSARFNDQQGSSYTVEELSDDEISSSIRAVA